MDRGRPDGPKRGCRNAEIVIAPSGAVVRPESIAHAKTLLAGGLAGKDAERLADRLIDIALNEGEWLWSPDR
jgi:hypothetical protein